MKEKIKRCRERDNNSSDVSDCELEKQIRRIDRGRAESHALVSDIYWGDKSGYHLCVNTSEYQGFNAPYCRICKVLSTEEF